MTLIQNLVSRVKKKIRISRIDEKETGFRITTSTCPDDLVRSVQSLGMIHLPILFQKKSGFQILSGFKRIEACRRLGITEINALILDPGTPEKSRAILAISDNSFQRELNLIETSRALNLLSRYFPNPEALSGAASGLRLPEHPVMISKLRKLSHLPEPVQDAVGAGAISLPVALALFELDPETAIPIATLFCELKLGFNQQRELMLLFEEIAFREQISLLDLVFDATLQKIRTDPDMDGNLKIRQIKAALMKRRFPYKTSMEEEFQLLVKKMKLGRGVLIKPSREFEAGNYSLTLEFEDMDSLKRYHEVLDKITGSLEFKRFIET
ncbi:MAG: ParB N-terminal domain-containing protein [Thermodesulfobacteriota bacterium]